MTVWVSARSEYQYIFKFLAAHFKSTWTCVY